MVVNQHYKQWIVVCCTVALAACNSTTVVLIPDHEGKVGHVVVDSGQREVALDQANQTAVAGSISMSKKQLSDENIKKRFAPTLAKEPKSPQRFVFYFDSGSANLLTEENGGIALAATAILERADCDTSVIGHTDRQGDAASNQALSIERATQIKTLLVAAGVDAKCLDIRYYGEHDPVIPTADEVSEPRNRRVVVEVR